MGQARFYYKDENAPCPNRPNHIGSTILLEYKGMLLLEHRADSERWAIIGGGLELGETLAECALREVCEETGIRLSEEEIRLYKIYDDPSLIISYPDGNVIRSIMAVYKTTLAEYPVLICSDESRELKFFTREELRTVPLVETHQPILEDYLY